MLKALALALAIVSGILEESRVPQAADGLPAVAAHFLVNAFIEPGLVLAAVRGEMGKRAGGSVPGKR